MEPQRLRSTATVVAVIALAAYSVARFRGAILTFFWLDDFWIMRDAARIQLDSAWDIGQFLRFSHVGFLMYRPLSTTAYAYLLHTLFAYDASAYHFFQLCVFALNVILVFAVARHLTQSAAAGFAAGLLYLLAPGQAVNAYWLSAFSVTGTAVWMLLMMWTWLAVERSPWRALLCALLQTMGLLASEHAVVGPALLVILSLARREPWRRIAAGVAPATLPVFLYMLAKVWYFASVRRPPAAYEVSLDIVSLLGQLGQYFSACFNILTLWPPGEPRYPALGGALALLLLISAWQAFRGLQAWRLLAAGIALFGTSLGPVLILKNHYYSFYICLGALGAALMVVGLCQVLSAHWRVLAVAAATALLVVDLATGERAWRQDKIVRLVVNGSNLAAGWVNATQQAVRAGNRAVFVEADTATGNIFTIGQIHTYFPAMPERLVRFNPAKPPRPWPGRAVLRGQQIDVAPSSPSHPAPGWDPRWDWLRELAAAG